MNMGSSVDTCTLAEVVVVVCVGGDAVDIDSVAESNATLDAVVGCVDPYSVGNVVDVCHDFRLKYSFDKRLGDCDEKLFSSFR